MHLYDNLQGLTQNFGWLGMNPYSFGGFQNFTKHFERGAKNNYNYKKCLQ
jgi:hypothetical protein